MVNAGVFIIALLLETFQLLPFYFAVGLRVTDKNPASISRYGSFIDNLFYLTGTYFVIKVGFQTITIISIIFLIISILIVGLMIYGESGEKKRSGEHPIQLAGFICKFISVALVALSTVTPLMLYIFMMKIFCCEYPSTGAVFVEDNSVPCWSGAHIGLVFVVGLDWIILIIFVIMFETIFADTNPKSPVPWSCTQANKVKLVKHFAKFVLSCFVVFDPYALYYNYFFVLEIAIYLLIFYLLFMSPAYINGKVGRTILFLESFMFFVVIEMYSLRIFNILVYSIGLVMFCVLSACVSVIVIFLKAKYELYILSNQVQTSKSESFKEYYFYEIFRLMDKYGTGDPEVMITIYGIFSTHQQLCTNPECTCSIEIINSNIEMIKKREDDSFAGLIGRTPDSGYDEVMSSSRSNMASMFQINNKSLTDVQQLDNKKKQTPYQETLEQKDNYMILLDMCSSLIEHEVKNNPGSVALRMISAFYSKEYVGNLFKAIYELIFIEEKQKPCLRDHFLIYKCKILIEEEMSLISKKGAVDSGIDVESLIKFEEYYEQLRTQAETESNIVNRFWEQLNSKDLDVNGLYEIGSKMGSLYLKMQQNFEDAITLFPHSYKLMSEFMNFERNVMNNEMIAKNYETRAKQILKEQAELHREGSHRMEENVTDINSVHHTCICIVSGNSSNLGEIMSMNRTVTYNLGFKAKDLVGQNIGVICPEFIRSKHNQIIENFIKRGTSNFLTNKKHVYAINSKGFLVILDTYIKILPAINCGIRFVGLFTKIEEFSDYFKDKSSIVTENDYGLIITNIEGAIIGINEACMTKLGIPVSLFSQHGGVDEKTLISSLIKEISEPEMEDILLSEGQLLLVDTKQLQLIINKENLHKREIRALETKANKYQVFVKQTNECYASGLVQAKAYHLIIKSFEPSPRFNKTHNSINSQKNQERPSLFSPGIQSDSQCVEKKLKDKEDANTNNEEEENAPPSSIKALNELKQNMNIKSATMDVTIIKRWINILFFVLLIFASVELALIITQHKDYEKSLKIVFVNNRRVIDMGMILSQIYTRVTMSQSQTVSTKLGTVDLYEFLREYGYRSIGTLSEEQDYLNTLDFNYNSALQNLEKSQSVQVVSLGKSSQVSSTYHTINTAMTQYTSKASDFVSYNFSQLFSLVSVATNDSDITSQYYFIKENGIGKLGTSVQKSEKEFREYWEDTLGRFFPYFIAAIVIIGVSLITCFGILIPKLLGLQREKINVLMLYTQMNKREVDAQIAKCLEYQKDNGFWDIEEENEDSTLRESISDDSSSVKIQKFFPAEVVSHKGNEESKEDLESGKPSSRFESEEEDDKPEDKRDESEISILEKLNSEQLKAKLSTKKCSLIALVLIVSSVYITYFLVEVVIPYYDLQEAKDALFYIHGLSEMLKAPLLLSVFSLISYTESRTLYVEDTEAIKYYLGQFLEVYTFKQHITTGTNSFLDKTKGWIEKLDSTQLCSVYIDLYKVIQAHYGKYSYTTQNSVTQTICESFENGLLQQGLTQAAFTIQQEVKNLQVASTSSSSSLNFSNVKTGLEMVEVFLAPIFEGLILDLNDNIEDSM